MTKYLHWSSAGAEPVPDCILVNGAGCFNCSMLIRTSTRECTEAVRPHLRAEKGKKYCIDFVWSTLGMSIFLNLRKCYKC
jgi:hypothetical protein